MLKTIGNTPLVKINNIYAKLEAYNPTGSIKDRMAKYLVEKAEQRGDIKPGWTIIEATSGNTGVSLAMISAIKGYKMIAVIPEHTSEVKKNLMKVFGAKLVLTADVPDAIEKANELAQGRKNIWQPKQFENPDNVEAHKKGLGQEILKQMPKIDAFVAAIGTGGTLMGIAQALKEKFPNVKIFGVAAAEKKHQIEGISDGLTPKILNHSLIDKTIKIKSADAIMMAKKLARERGILAGISSGANVLAAM